MLRCCIVSAFALTTSAVHSPSLEELEPSDQIDEEENVISDEEVIVKDAAEEEVEMDDANADQESLEVDEDEVDGDEPAPSAAGQAAPPAEGQGSATPADEENVGAADDSEAQGDDHEAQVDDDDDDDDDSEDGDDDDDDEEEDENDEGDEDDDDSDKGAGDGEHDGVAVPTMVDEGDEEHAESEGVEFSADVPFHVGATDQAAVFAEAKAQGKPAMVIATKNWCPHCADLAHSMSADAEVKSLMTKFVAFHAPDAQGEAWHGEIGYVPRVFFFNKDANQLDVSGANQQYPFFFADSNDIKGGMKKALGLAV